MKRHLLRREQLFYRSRDEIFPFFSKAENLARITPPELDFEIETPLPIEMKLGTLLDYKLSLYRVPFRWRTRISVWDPPNAFVDEQVRGPYGLWEHHHQFHETREGTMMVDEVVYGLPLSPLGEIAHPIVRRQLERIFDYRRDRVQEILAAV